MAWADESAAAVIAKVDKGPPRPGSGAKELDAVIHTVAPTKGCHGCRAKPGSQAEAAKAFGPCRVGQSEAGTGQASRLAQAVNLRQQLLIDHDLELLQGGSIKDPEHLTAKGLLPCNGFAVIHRAASRIASGLRLDNRLLNQNTSAHVADGEMWDYLKWVRWRRILHHIFCEGCQLERIRISGASQHYGQIDRCLG